MFVPHRPACRPAAAFVALIVMLTVGDAAFAGGIERAEIRHPNEWGVGDFFAAAGIASGVGATLLVGGTALGYGSESCEDYGGDDCGLRALDTLGVAAVLTPFASAGAVAIYGDVRGFSGSYWAAVGGSATATLLGYLIAVAAFDGDEASNMGLMGGFAVAQGVLATAGYALTLEKPSRRYASTPRTPTVIDFTEGVSAPRLGYPNVAIRLERDGGYGVQVPLLGAHF